MGNKTSTVNLWRVAHTRCSFNSPAQHCTNVREVPGPPGPNSWGSTLPEFIDNINGPRFLSTGNATAQAALFAEYPPVLTTDASTLCFKVPSWARYKIYDAPFHMFYRAGIRKGFASTSGFIDTGAGFLPKFDAPVMEEFLEYMRDRYIECCGDLEEYFNSFNPFALEHTPENHNFKYRHWARDRQPDMDRVFPAETAACLSLFLEQHAIPNRVVPFVILVEPYSKASDTRLSSYREVAFTPRYPRHSKGQVEDGSRLIRNLFVYEYCFLLGGVLLVPAS